MAQEAPAVIAAREKTKQTRANARARQAEASARTRTAEERTAQEREKRASREQPTTRVDNGPTNPPPRQSSGGGISLPKVKPGGGSRVVASAWFAGLAVITWQEVKKNHEPPEPARFVGWSGAMSILDLIAPLISETLAGVFAVGLVLGLMLFRKATVDQFTDPASVSGQATGSTGNAAQGVAAPGAQVSGLTGQIEPGNLSPRSHATPPAGS